MRYRFVGTSRRFRCFDYVIDILGQSDDLAIGDVHYFTN